MDPGSTRQEYAPYQNFWRRYWAATLDGGILSVLSLAISVHAMTEAPVIAVGFLLLPYLYSIGFHAWRGQTPGKLVAAIRVTRPDGSRIHLREAVLRDSVPVLLTVASMLFLAAEAMRAPDSGSVQLSWFGYRAVSWIGLAWFVLEIATMLTNSRRRALHDFLAGTVVVRVAPAARVEVETVGSQVLPANASDQRTKPRLRPKHGLLLLIVLIGGAGFLSSMLFLSLFFISSLASGGGFRMLGVTHERQVEHRLTLTDAMFSQDSTHLATAVHEVVFHPANQSFPTFWAAIPEWFVEGHHHVRVYEREDLKHPIWELDAPAERWEGMELLTWEPDGILLHAHKSLKESRFGIWNPVTGLVDSVFRDSVHKETYLASRRRRESQRPWRIRIVGDELYLWNVVSEEKQLVYQLYDDPPPMVSLRREAEVWQDSFHRLTDMAVEVIGDSIRIETSSRPARAGNRGRAYEWTIEIAVPDMEAEKRREFGTENTVFRVFTDSLPPGPSRNAFWVPVDTVLAILDDYPARRVVTVNQEPVWGVGTQFSVRFRCLLGEEEKPLLGVGPAGGGYAWRGCFIPLRGPRWRPEWRAFAKDIRRRSPRDLPLD